MPRQMTSNSPRQLNGTSRWNGCDVSGLCNAHHGRDELGMGFYDFIVGGGMAKCLE